MTKNKIFSGRQLSERSKASIELHDINRELKKAGLEPIKPGGSSLKKLQAAQEKGKEALEQYQNEQERKRQEEEERRREEEERRREEEERREERLSRYSEFVEMGRGYTALFTVLTAEEAEDIKNYDSSDMLEIGEKYLSNPDYKTIFEASDAYYAQAQEAFDEMNIGEFEADFTNIPFF